MKQNTLSSRAAGSMAGVCAFLFFISSFSYSLAGVTAKQYGQLPGLDMMVISPQGERVAYRLTTGDTDRIMVLSLTENKIVSGINLTDKITPTDVYFIDEDKLVLVVSDHARIRGFIGRHDISTAYILNIEDNKIRSLLRSGGVVYAGQTGLGNVIGISNDRKNVYMPAWAGDAKVNDRPNYAVFEVPVNAPNRQRVHKTGNRYSIDFYLDQAGEVFVEERYDNEKNRHTILARSGKEWNVLYEEDAAIRIINTVGITPDYKSLVVKGYDAGTEQLTYFLMSLKTGEISGSGFLRADVDVESVLTDINRVVYGVRYSGFNPDYKILDEKIDRRVSDIVKMFPGNSAYLISWSDDWSSLVVYIEGSGYPGDFFVFTEGKEPRFLGSSRSEIAPEDIHPIATYTYKAEDGLEIPTLLTIPKDMVNNLKMLPAIMLPHGGPKAYDAIGFEWIAQALANEGYLVIQPQFRGSSGFGLQHYLAGEGQWGKKMQSDISDGIKSLSSNGYIDPSRVCIAGFSYGGYAALAGGAFTPELYKCVVSVAGVSDLNQMLYSEKFEHGKDHWVVDYFKQSIAAGNVTKQSLKAVSPAQFAANFRAPVLLLHGGNDEVVPIKQSKLMRSRLKLANKDVRFIELKNEGHNLSFNNTRQEALTHIIDFINENLKK